MVRSRFYLVEDVAGMPLVECVARVAEELGCPLYMIPGGHNEAGENPEIFAQAVMKQPREECSE